MMILKLRNVVLPFGVSMCVILFMIESWIIFTVLSLISSHILVVLSNEL